MTMIKITSRKIPDALWAITLDGVCSPVPCNENALSVKDVITKEDYDFIRDLNPGIYFNDQTCVHWCFDERLPSGRWLENISVEWRSSLVFKALIVY